MKLAPHIWLRLFVVGAIGGAASDQIHVQAHVLAYPRDDVLQQSWWVAPNFGLAALLIALTGSGIARWATRLQPRTVDDRALFTGFAWFTAAYLASALVPFAPPLMMVLFAVTWLARVLPRRDRLPQLLEGVGLAVGGTCFEALLSSTGAFHYVHPDFGPVPSWLPGLYLHGAPLALAWLVRLQHGRNEQTVTDNASRAGYAPDEPQIGGTC